MEKITLNEYLKQGSVVENLKNFVGVTPENTVGLMTPERLAAVAGGKMDYGLLVKGSNIDDVKQGKYVIESGFSDLFKAGALLFVDYVINGKYCVQMAFLLSGNNIAFRIKTGQGWTEWKTILP